MCTFAIRKPTGLDGFRPIQLPFGAFTEGCAEDDPSGGRLDFVLTQKDAKAKWLYKTRHMLAELKPKPEFVTVAVGTTQWDIVSMMSPGDIKGAHLEDPEQGAVWAGMIVDAAPAIYVEHLKRLRQRKIQPYFVPAHIHQLEVIERLIRAGVHMGPMNCALAGYGGPSAGIRSIGWRFFPKRRRERLRQSGPACAD